MTDSNRVSTGPAGPSKRALYTAYASGGANNAVNMMLRVVVPLWALQLGMSPSMIGIAIGAGGVLPFLLSIHGGVLMDRFGTRRVNVILTLLGTIAMALYPLLPIASALIVLQMITGFTTNMGWMGAQSMIVQIAPGDTAVIGKFSIASRVGTLVAPVLTGAVWDLTGHWGAFLFITISSVATFLAFYWSPAAEVDATATREQTSVRDLIPRFSEYIQAFAMMAVPVIAFVSVITFVRIGGAAVQGSFYIVYLEHIGISGTMIGVLMGVSEGFGMFGSGIAGRIERALKPHWTLILFHALAIFFVCVTPFLGGIMVLLVLAAMMRGSSQGLGQPVMFAVLSRAVSREEQGRSIGLRTTINRISSMGVPPFMGIIAEHSGLEASFAITGVIFIGVSLGAVVFARGIKAFQG